MEFELVKESVSKTTPEPLPMPYKTAKLGGKTYWVLSKVKARHMVQVEKLYGTKLGDVEKGLYVLATLLYEAMGTEALTYEQMLEYELDDLTPLLELIS